LGFSGRFINERNVLILGMLNMPIVTGVQDSTKKAKQLQVILPTEKERPSFVK